METNSQRMAFSELLDVRLEIILDGEILEVFIEFIEFPFHSVDKDRFVGEGVDYHLVFLADLVDDDLAVMSDPGEE